MQTVISWVLFGVCLFLGVFDFIDKDIVRGIAMILCCVICLPQTASLFSREVESRRFFVAKILIVIIFILGASLRVPG